MRDFPAAISSRVLIYGGGLGATLEQMPLGPKDYLGLEGKCHEALVLGRPDVIESVHAAVFEAGASCRDRQLPGVADQARRVGPRRAHA